MLHPQDEAHEQSLSPTTRAAFWARQAAHLVWERAPSPHSPVSTTPTRISSTAATGGVTYDSHAWFADGALSTCYNCVDRHVDEGRGDRVAVHYDSPVSGVRSRLTYAQLRDEVALLAGVLRGLGVGVGDVVMIYMPLLLQTLVALLASSRIGAPHAVVFGGFAAPALAQRILSARPTVLLTASCGLDGVGAGKPPLSYQALVEEAVSLAASSGSSGTEGDGERWQIPGGVVVWQREGMAVRFGKSDRRDGTGFWELPRWHLRPIGGPGKEVAVYDWASLLASAREANAQVLDCVAVPATAPLYILYTSGTTGAPKGVVRDVGGHAVGLHLSMRSTFGISRDDVMFTASDLGWVVGHGYMAYGPLLVGAATVLYEGKPVGTPDASELWRVVERYRVSVLFTAPTALRAVRREDGPRLEGLREVGTRGGLKSLRALFLAGERSEPRIVREFQTGLGRWAADGFEVVDNWWTTEVGSPITARSLAPHVCLVDTPAAAQQLRVPPVHLKPGSAGKPTPGFDVRIVDDDGRELPPGRMGNVVLALPLAPTAFRTLWRDDERYYRSYLARFGGRWLDTGDAGMVDEDGFVHIMARTDDVINVAGHRLSSGAIEQALTSHPLVVEGCVVGIPDALKGHLPFAFVTLSASPDSAKSENATSKAEPPQPPLLHELNALVRAQVGPIATLGGVITAVPAVGDPNIIPRTRSGKTLRRTLRGLVEAAARRHGSVGLGSDPVDDAAGRQREEEDLKVPATIEDIAVIDAARRKVEEYFLLYGHRHVHDQGHHEEKAKL